MMSSIPGVRPGSLLLVLLLAALSHCVAASEAPSFEQALGALATSNFKQKERAAGELVGVRHANTRAVLDALLEGNLYYRKADKRVFIAVTQEAGLELRDALTLQSAGTADAADFSKITTNNQLRKTLRSALASFDLTDPDAQVRLGAVNEMLRSLDADSVSILRARERDEKDESVRQAIRTGLAIADLNHEDAARRLSAVEQLKGSLNPEVFNRLTALVSTSDDGSYTEPDAKVRSAARAALAGIENSRSFYSMLETLFFGLSLGSVLVLAAIGLAITFGVMGVINMAHGELMMLGAYTTYVVQLIMPQHIGASVLVAIPVAFVVAGGVGVLIERGVVRFLYGRPLETLLATFGVSLVLQQIVRDIFTANNRPVETPSWMSGSLQINEAFSITYNRLYVVLFMLIVFVILQWVLKKTSLGLKVRAVAQNRAMAKSMGVRTEWVDALTFGLGSGIAGVAGVALSQLTNVGPNLGQAYIIDSFMVVVFGGVGNLWGTLIGGMSLGVVNQFLEPHAGAVLAKILVLIALILFIQRRPRGLFPQLGRAAEG
ncbi:urea ABC transporter permease subunit UrtB [Steroidobacter sp. S1-65]|uniref:Urea ABC transporter permease subunit UrtB n=1 Tax=Steroidobacter gossypii TaxID=2805490 RepID=A0ABS1WUZ5_9GAMM|nr:urea ABC transporter permease subunit UrtB [Steroidobacter gossypii]MBM0104790.1 urea ABC transporter permease subunit UrtB [Steroidobacter gossypii]